jgi:hypothetical protein
MPPEWSSLFGASVTKKHKPSNAVEVILSRLLSFCSTMIDSLYAIPMWVKQKSTVIIGVVMRTKTRRAITPTAVIYIC